jgi:hypothetical protein
MLNRRAMLSVLSNAVVAGFVFGIVYLFHLRFSAGDIYPPGSSLRADPLGTKVFYESLGNIPGLSVSRFYQQASKLYGNRQRALFLIETSADALNEMSATDYKAMQDFLHQGGRAIICLSPERINTKQPDRKTGPGHRDTNTDERLEKPISFLATNGLTLMSDPLPDGDADVIDFGFAEVNSEFADMPETISWRSPSFFSHANDWRTVYSRKKHPVMIEKSFGAGSLVISTDSYFVSNEALRKERHTPLLVWLVGDRREILFDETHLGVEQQPGVAALIRQYRLGGAVAGLLLLAVLFIWKNRASLVPPAPNDLDGAGQPYVLGKESGAGFASLLRRSILSKDIVLTAFEEWKEACARDPRAVARLPEIQKIIDEEKARAPGARRPVATYQAIRRILTQHHL